MPRNEMVKSIGRWLAQESPEMLSPLLCQDCMKNRREKADWLVAEQAYKDLIRRLEASLSSK